MSNILFADSGGTGTDWVYRNSEGYKIFFETESYHPSNWNEDFWKRFAQYWKSNESLLENKLHFFGAGCFNKKNAQLLQEKFQTVGFVNVQVKSDLHAAGYSSYKRVEGDVIIAGTGSVWFHYSNDSVSQIVGGKGHEIGDEGSGYYFGKLIIERYKNNTLTNPQLEILNNKLDLESLSKIDSLKKKYGWSTLSKELQEYKKVFENIHIENIGEFIKTHFKKSKPRSVCLVGSYAYYHKELWIEKLDSIGVNVNDVILKPIEHFIE